MKTIEEIKQVFRRLPADTQSLLLDDLLQEKELQGTVLTNAYEEVSSKRKNKSCPHCKSDNVYKRGRQKGVQMYKCNYCNKWYSETTGTPLYGLKLKSKLQAYLRCMEQGMPIKKIATEIGTCIQTSFDWRHKILTSLNQFIPSSLSGDLECDELELSLNNKGDKNLQREPRKRASDFKRNQGKEKNTVVQVVTVIERGGAKFLRAVKSKRLSKEEITIALEDKIDGNATLITDKHPSYKSFAKEHKRVNHKTVLAKNHVNKQDRRVNLQKVNNVHSQLRTFLRPFNGVSSKYLQNYLNWFAYADKIRETKETIKLWIVSALFSEQAYELFFLFKENAVLIRT